MKIVMLGHSSAGKTTYMSAMYDVGRVGFTGFRIRTKDPAQEAELVRRAGDIERGCYPPPSARRDRYDFVLSYRQQDVRDFTWSDYRGGALLDRSTDAETKAVLDDLVSADGIIVFADAQALALETDGARVMRRLTVLLQRAVADRTRPVPLIVAYTKADLVSSDPAVWQGIRAPLAPVMDAARASSTVLATDVAVACGPAASHVEVPLLWCLGNSLINDLVATESELAESRRDLKEYGAKTNPIDSARAFFDGRTSYAKMARDEREAIKEGKAELRTLRKPATKLAASLARYHPDGAGTVNAARTQAQSAASARRARSAVVAGQVVLMMLVLVGGLVVFVGLMLSMG